MAINKNHEFEELDGVKCGIVERNVSKERAEFLSGLLAYNNYEVKVVPVQTKAKPAAANNTEQPETESTVEAPTPSLYTIGVTDYTFNPINAIFGRMLRTTEGQVVTLAYWQQKDTVSRDDKPYFE